MTLTELNEGDRDEFVRALGWIFEGSPWVAARAWSSRPFATRERLHHAMVEMMLAAEPAEQGALLCAHPELGTTARMSDASVGEQTGAGLDRLTADDYRRLTTLTGRYRVRFGFPFVLAVKGRTTGDVLAALERRVDHDVDTERREALNQVARIAALRLADTVVD